MPQLTANQVHIDQPLTNLTIAYLQSTSAFIADKVFPNVPVSKLTDKYYIYNRKDFLRTGQVKPLAPRTRPERVGMGLSTDAYAIEVRGLATDFDFQTLANEDTSLQIRAAGVRLLTHQLLLDREKRWMDTYFAAGVWATEYTGVASAPTASQFIQWSDYTNSDPIKDVTTFKRAAMLKSGGFMPNIMVMTPDVRDTLINHPDILARLNGGATVSDPALVTDAKLAEIFGVSKIYIPEAVQNTAAEGLAESLSWVATRKVALYHTPVAPGLMVPAAGYNFTWATLDNSSGYGVEVRSYAGDWLAAEGIAEELQAVMAYDMKVVGNELGVFLADAIA